jgi:Tol biopolymer transport system component
MRLPLRPQVLAVLTFALVWLAGVVPGAEASFPGRNGLIAFAGEGPPFNTKRVPEGAWTIRVVNPRMGRARQLTHVPRRCGRRGWTWSDSEPSYSASGRLLAYVHTDSCDPRTADGLYIMRADGSGRRLIRRMTSDEDDLPEYPAISPSGKLLAFSQYLGSTYTTSATRPDGEQDLGFACLEHKRRCPLWRYSEVQQPAWSPNGRRLALTLSGPDGQGELGIGQIGTVGTRGLGLRLVTRSTGDAMPDWSPTGDRIVLHRSYFRQRVEGNVFIAPTDATRPRRPRRLTETGDAFFPVWSPNGRYIAYVRDRNAFLGPGSLWITRAADGGGQRLVASRIIDDRISWQPLPRR